MARIVTSLSLSFSDLTDEDFEIAKNKKFQVLLLCSDSIVFKLMTLMMEKINVRLHVSPDVQTAKTIMSTLPADEFDAVLVAPGRCDEITEADLQDMSRFISSPPYKIPMLGCFYDAEEVKSVNF